VCIDDEGSLDGTPGRPVGLESYQAASASPKPATRGRHCDGIDPTSAVVVVVVVVVDVVVVVVVAVVVAVVEAVVIVVIVVVVVG
jgi:hypothetical protein